MQGKFIVLEGPDGSGTTTHSSLLAEELRREGRDVLFTAEPTNSAIGFFIRKQLKAKAIDSPSALQLLFCADRAAHIETVIRPAIKAGKTVISDRYVISTLIYGEALGLDPEWLLHVNTPFLQPDVMMIALPAFEVCMQRIGQRSQLDIFENLPFQRKIYDLYQRALDDDKSIVHIDTGKSQAESAQEVLRAVRLL
jgi:dTMP kinase